MNYRVANDEVVDLAFRINYHSKRDGKISAPFLFTSI